MDRFGRYELLRRVGTGGMAEIWKARVEGPGGFQKSLAIKRLLPDLVENAEFLRMFVDEAKLVADLSHPNIVQVLDLGHVGKHEYFIAMEYVPGVNLARLLNRTAQETALARLPPEAALHIAVAAASGLGHAHARGCVHRDVSPQNILLSFAGDVKLTDFGIARVQSVIPRTAEGHVRGKIAYMSPEQATGTAAVDGRSDLFALGIVFFEMLTGQRLFPGGSSPENHARVISFPGLSPEELAVLPPALRGIVSRALQREPGRRWPDANAFEREMTAVLGPDALLGGRQFLARRLQQLFPDEYRLERDDEDRALATNAQVSLADVDGPTTPGAPAEPPLVVGTFAGDLPFEGSEPGEATRVSDEEPSTAAGGVSYLGEPSRTAEASQTREAVLLGEPSVGGDTVISPLETGAGAFAEPAPLSSFLAAVGLVPGPRVSRSAPAVPAAAPGVRAPVGVVASAPPPAGDTEIAPRPGGRRAAAAVAVDVEADADVEMDLDADLDAALVAGAPAVVPTPAPPVPRTPMATAASFAEPLFPASAKRRDEARSKAYLAAAIVGSAVLGLLVGVLVIGGGGSPEPAATPVARASVSPMRTAEPESASDPASASAPTSASDPTPVPAPVSGPATDPDFDPVVRTTPRRIATAPPTPRRTPTPTPSARRTPRPTLAPGEIDFFGDASSGGGNASGADAFAPPTPGRLRVDADPPCEVYVDRKRVTSSTPLDLELSPGPHTLGFVHPATGMWIEREYEIPEGGTLDLFVDVNQAIVRRR